MSRRALAHLRTDPVLARVIERVGPCRLRPRREGTHFEAIARSIIYQQLSGKAAGTIHGRWVALFDGRPTPEALLALSDEAQRAAGLSRQKLSYLRDLADKSASGRLAIERLHELADEEVIAQLAQVKGVGRWTAQMFLLFRLGRPDVLPTGDLGIQKGIQRAFRLRKLPTPKRVEEIGRKWSPWSSIASWYLWRLLDVETP